MERHARPRPAGPPLHVSSSAPRRRRWLIPAGLVALVSAVAVMPTGPSGAQAVTSSTSSTPTSAPASTTTSTSTTSTSTTSTSTTTTTRPATTTVPATTSTVAPVAPGVPANPTAQITGTAQITVTWQAPASTGGLPITAYKVGIFPGTAVLTVAPGTVSAQFNDLVPGTSYSFYVRAENAVGAGQPSGWTNPLLVPSPVATTLPPPAAPTAVLATASAPNRVLVTWQPPAANGSAPIAQYRITTSPSLGTITAPASTLSALFTTARTNVVYTVQVRAVTTTGVVSAPATAAPVVISLTVVPAVPVATAPANLPLPPQPPTPPGVPKPCVTTRWPASAYGKPYNFRTGAPQGVYVWHDGRYWNVKAYHPGPGTVVFTGSIAANTKVTFYASGIERGDVLSRARTSARFSFRSNYDIDGIRISAACATLLRFNFQINGVPAPVYLGSGPATPGAAFDLVR